MNHKKSVLSRLVAAPYYLWAILFIIAPLVFVIIYAFTDSNNNFTTENFTKLFGDGSMKVFFLSLAFAFIATLVCLVIAYPLAYIITKAPKKRQNSLLMLFMLPMWMNFLLRTYALSFLLEDNGLINTVLNAIGIGSVKLIYTSTAVIFGMVYNFLPYMILPIYTVMSKIDNGLIEAAQDLGSNNFTVFRKVVAPLSVPGIISGVTMVFVPSASTFLVAQYLGGPDDIMIGDVIEKIFWTDQNTGSAISLILMIFIFVFLIIMNLFGDEEAIA